MKTSRFASIALIDSGIGGLAMLKQLYKKYPNENYIYLADNQNMPYGNKSARFIKQRVLELINYLHNTFNVKLVIIACNTASVSALDYVQTRVPVRVVGLNLDKWSNADNAILCTKLSSKIYSGNTYPCNKLANYIEENIFNKPQLKRKIKHTLDTSNLTEPNIVLGCTHYELVANIFKEYSNKNIILPCQQFVNKYQLDYPNLSKDKGSILMISTLGTKSYTDKLWHIFKN